VKQEQPLDAGGQWQAIEERTDPTVVKQFNQDACAAACGEMLLRDRGIETISQQDIARVADGLPMELEDLKDILNTLSGLPGQWKGGAIELPNATNQQLMQALNSTGSWAAGLWEDGKLIGHAVVVDGFDSQGRLLIRDPWGLGRRAKYGSRYKIRESRLFLECGVCKRFITYNHECHRLSDRTKSSSRFRLGCQINRRE
jgi:filamentous hemagglutinin